MKKKQNPVAPKGETQSSYDVTFSPMVNVKLHVADPLRPTEKEVEEIIRLAVQAVFEYGEEVISGENVDSIRLYESDTRKGPVSAPITIYPKPAAVKLFLFHGSLSALQELEKHPAAEFLNFDTITEDALYKAKYLIDKTADWDYDLEVDVFEFTGKDAEDQVASFLKGFNNTHDFPEEEDGSGNAQDYSWFMVQKS